jgi:hypothetical protein
MDIAIPHSLGREEARRRLRENGHRMADGFPGGMAQVTTGWPSEDRMDMAIAAMGQSLTGHIDVGDAQVVLCIDVPPALGFIRPIVEGAIRQQGQKLLAPPASE